MKKHLHSKLAIILVSFLLFTFSAYSQTTISVKIATSSNDAEEGGNNGAMTLYSSDLEIGEYDTWEQDGIAQGLQTIGLRFPGVEIPANASIVSASIVFTCDKAGAGPVEMTIYGEDEADPDTFSVEAYDITDRSWTPESVVWPVPEWLAEGDVGEAQTTTDLSVIVQAMVDRNNWYAGNSMVFIMEPSGVSIGVTDPDAGREAETADGSSDGTLGAVLNVTYEINTGTDFSTQIVASSDDAEEGSNNGAMTLTSSDLELGEYDTWEQDGVAQGLQTIGLRFPEIEVPANATIVSANIVFTCDKAGAGPAEMTIYGQDEADPDTFSVEAYNITDRSKTTESVVWPIPEWLAEGDAGEAQTTTDLAAIVQALVDKPGWNAGNSMAFIFEHSGVSIGVTDPDAGREAETADGSSDGTLAPSLNITYLVSTGISPVSKLSSLIYPNPTGGMFKIDNPSADKFTYEIYTYLGKQILSSQEISNTTADVDLSNYANGVYFVIVRSANKVETHKLILK